jgi:hypothetical protein
MNGCICMEPPMLPGGMIPTGAIDCCGDLKLPDIGDCDALIPPGDLLGEKPAGYVATPGICLAGLSLNLRVAGLGPGGGLVVTGY